jgi:atypical dual specificity phosphatase
MVSRVIFYPSLLYGVLHSKLRSQRHWYDRIDETVILGALPFRSIIPKLKSENVSAIVNMTEPYETRFLVSSTDELASQGISRLTLSTRDYVEAPTQLDLYRGVQFIMKHKREGHSVYVHCKAGRTRSTTLVACYLMQLHRWSPEKSVQFIRSIRPHIKLHNRQWVALKLYYRSSNI